MGRSPRPACLPWSAHACRTSSRTTSGPRPLSLADAPLVAWQARLPLAQAWGGGMIAAVDGMRFVIPIPTALLTDDARSTVRPGQARRRHLQW
ncbi:Tn3 family transposase [Nonomuraea sp. bgisy094]|uniref:Tn3 family transposase n=1 Tax=Nonomuraea sp. bgisy094 TaxID=3413781 RepID=UPI003EBE021A